MAETSSASEAAAVGPGAEPRGRAALLLVDSLIHSLLDNGVLTIAQADEAIESALEVTGEEDEMPSEPGRTMGLLIRLQRSVQAHSVGEGGGPPVAARKEEEG